MVPADDNVCPYTTFSSLLNLGSLIESVLDPNRARCYVVPDLVVPALGTNYLQWLYQQRDGIISVLRCGQFYLTQREFVHLCEKVKGSMAQSDLLSCSYRERNLVYFLYNFMDIVPRKHMKVI